MAFGGLGGLAFVGEGYDQGAEAYWRRQQAEWEAAGQQGFADAIRSGLLNTPQASPPIDFGSYGPAPTVGATPVQPQSLAGQRPEDFEFAVNPRTKLPMVAPGSASRFGPTIPGQFGAGTALPFPQLGPRADVGGIPGRISAGQSPEDVGVSRVPSGDPSGRNIDYFPTKFGTWPVVSGDQAAAARRAGGPSMVSQGPIPPSPLSMMPAATSPPTVASVSPPGPVPPAGPGGPRPSMQQQVPQWQSIVSQIIRSNPGAPPEAIAGAVLKAIPIMTMLSQQEQQVKADQWRQFQEFMELQRERDAQRRLDISERSEKVRERNEESLADYRQFRERFMNPEMQANAYSLKRLQASYDALVAFENTANRNGERLAQLAEKVDYTGVPAINRWIKAGRQSLAGDPGVTDFNIQYQAYLGEVSRAISNPNLSGVLPVTVRREFEESLPQASNAEQIRQAVDTAKQDMAIRNEEMSSQLENIKGRIRGEPAKATPPSASPSSAAPAGAGWKVEEVPGKQSGLNRGEGQVMSDVSPEPVRAGQQYAANLPPRPGETMATPGRIGGEGGAGGAMPTVSGMPQRTVPGKVNQFGPSFSNRPEDVARMQEMLSKGKTLNEISEELGVGPRVLRRYSTDELGIRQRGPQLQDDPKTIARYQDMVKRGFSQRQMAEKIGTNVGTVSKQLNALRKAGKIDYVPGGGTRTPSMPRFEFKDKKPGEIDEDYIKALEKYLKDIRAYYNKRGAMENV